MLTEIIKCIFDQAWLLDRLWTWTDLVIKQVMLLCTVCICCLPCPGLPAMGNLIKVLGKDLENCPHFFLDFESKCLLLCGVLCVSVCERSGWMCWGGRMDGLEEVLWVPAWRNKNEAGKKSFTLTPWHHTKHPSLPGLCQHVLIHSIHTPRPVHAPDVTHICIHKHTHHTDLHEPSITHTRLPSFCSRGLMGNLLKVLTCAELEHGPIVFLDFERELISFLFFEFCFFIFLALLIPICVRRSFHFLFSSIFT